MKSISLSPSQRLARQKVANYLQKANVVALLAKSGTGRTTILRDIAINQQSELVASLTERENEILVMMMEDHTNEDIANHLKVSVRTINAHKGNIMRKVGAKTTSGLIKTVLDYSAILKTRL